MSHWGHRVTEGAEFRISCKRPAFLSNFSRLQLIQNSAPSVTRWRQCDIRIHARAPVNIRIKTLEALNDAHYVAPLVETGDCHSSLNARSWFYVFDYQTKNSYYKQVCFCVLSTKARFWYWFLQVNDYEIVVNFFHISHNLTWYSAIVHKFTRIYQVCSTYELTQQFM